MIKGMQSTLMQTTAIAPRLEKRMRMVDLPHRSRRLSVLGQEPYFDGLYPCGRVLCLHLCTCSPASRQDGNDKHLAMQLQMQCRPLRDGSAARNVI